MGNVVVDDDDDVETFTTFYHRFHLLKAISKIWNHLLCRGATRGQFEAQQTLAPLNKTASSFSLFLSFPFPPR